MKVACIQSSYIPWKGYFDIIHDVEIFVFLDDVQMTLRDWRSRNKIKTAKGTEWLTVPVAKVTRHQLIRETLIAAGDWQRRHLKALQFNYGRAPFFQDYRLLLDWLYAQSHTNLSEFNRRATGMICEILGIKTRLLASMDLDPVGTKDDRLIDICKKLGAQTYLSGPSARDYIVAEKIEAAGIELIYKDYAGYPEYLQQYSPFSHDVTVLDVLFKCGPQAPDRIWGWRGSASLQPQ